MREKLIELLDNFQYKLSDYAGNNKCFVVDDHIELADHLITNGVTVQKWIPVTERLPNKDTLVLCVGKRGGMFIGTPSYVYSNDNSASCYVPNSRSHRCATHWSYLPQPPKED